MKKEKLIEKEIKGKKWQDALDKAFEKRNKDLSIKGFRKGKAPKKLFLKKYGIESLFQEAIEEVVDKAYEDAVKEIDIEEVAARPSMDVKEIDEKHCLLEFKFILKPDVKVKKYKGFDIKYDDVKVTKDEIKDAIDQLLSQYSELEIKDGKAELGDYVNIDFLGKLDGKEFDGGKAENYSLELGSNTFIPGFENQVIGLKKGDEKTFDIKFPKDYHAEEFQGKTAEFTVKVREVKEVVEREIDDEFFEDLGMEGIDSKESLEEEVKKNLKVEKERKANDNFMKELLETLRENTEVEIPKEMLEEEKMRLFDSFANVIQTQGIDIGTYMELTGNSIEELDKQLEPEAEKNIVYRLMLEELEKELDIKTNKKDYEERVKELAEANHMSEEDLVYNFGGKEAMEYETKIHKLLEELKKLNIKK